MMHPIKSDQRYSVAREYTGHVKPQWVVRFCGQWVDSSAFCASVVAMAVVTKAARDNELNNTKGEDL
jgi:hypothetical protein